MDIWLHLVVKTDTESLLADSELSHVEQTHHMPTKTTAGLHTERERFAHGPDDPHEEGTQGDPCARRASTSGG